MAASDPRLAARYGRIRDQLAALFVRTRDPLSRMATIAALLQHKMPHFFWTGFYRVSGDKLLVGPYQGPLACAVLDAPDGVCWAGVNGGEPVLVPDVEAFPGHVACDGRSRSEVVLPVRDPGGTIVAVLDVDSDQPDAFSRTDLDGLAAIVALVHADL